MDDTYFALRISLEACKPGPLYLLAADVGDEAPKEYLDELLFDEPAGKSNLDAGGHCSRCCQKNSKSSCSGCPGRIRSRDVRGFHGYGNQTEEWSIDCPLCGEIREEDDDDLAVARVGTAVAYDNHQENVFSVVPERLAAASECLHHPARLLLQHAEQCWDRDEPFSAGLLILAAIVEGAPRDEILKALSLAVGAVTSMRGCTCSTYFETNLKDLDTSTWKQLAPAMQARAEKLSTAGFHEDAAFLTELVDDVSWQWAEPEAAGSA